MFLGDKDSRAKMWKQNKVKKKWYNIQHSNLKPWINGLILNFYEFCYIL